jgi:hypothetical protein
LTESIAVRALREMRDIVYSSDDLKNHRRNFWQNLPNHLQTTIIKLAKTRTPITLGRVYGWDQFADFEKEELCRTIRELQKLTLALKAFDMPVVSK